MIERANSHSIAPTEPGERARYIRELKAAYQRGELCSQLVPADIDDRVVRVVLPHLYPAVIAEA
jgi:hypothetical protein